MISPARALHFCCALLILGLTPSASRAHGYLKSSSPADKSSTAAPRELRLVFTERPELTLTRIVLLRSGRDTIPVGPMTASGADLTTVTVPLIGEIAPGVYTVAWATVGKDGHPVGGTFSFTVHGAAVGDSDRSAPATQATRARIDSEPAHHDTLALPTSADRFDAQSTGYVIVRFVLYAALLVVIGVVAFRFMVLGLMGRGGMADVPFVEDAARRAATVGMRAASILLLACLARLLAQSMALGGSTLGESQRLGGLLLATGWGRAWVIQLSASAIVIAAMRSARHAPGRGLRRSWVTAGIAALVLAFTPAFASHAASTPDRSALAIAADGLHVLGASGWLGTLLVVLLAGIPSAMALAQGRGTAVAALFNAFSPTAVGFAALVGLTGVFAAWLHVGGFAPLWESTYGRLLIAKLAVLVGAALIGAYHWLVVRPSLGSDAAAVRIRRSASIEVALGALVLAVTAILVAMPTPMDAM
jgi:putative copper export protein/methionine-rich copper-binding protein CopC